MFKKKNEKINFNSYFRLKSNIVFLLGIVEQEKNRSFIWYIACHRMSWRTRDILNNTNHVPSPVSILKKVVFGSLFKKVVFGSLFKKVAFGNLFERVFLETFLEGCFFKPFLNGVFGNLLKVLFGNLS